MKPQKHIKKLYDRLHKMTEDGHIDKPDNSSGVEITISIINGVGVVVFVETGSGLFDLGDSTCLKIAVLIRLQDSVNKIKLIERRMHVFFQRD